MPDAMMPVFSQTCTYATCLAKLPESYDRRYAIERPHFFIPSETAPAQSIRPEVSRGPQFSISRQSAGTPCRQREREHQRTTSENRRQGAAGYGSESDDGIEGTLVSTSGNTRGQRSRSQDRGLTERGRACDRD